jgi:hypothetical protein
MAEAKVNEELDFTPAPLQATMISAYDEVIRPNEADINAKVLSFDISNSNSNDLIKAGECELQTTVAIVDDTGAFLTWNQADVGVIDNAAHSMWQDVLVEWEQHVLERTNGTYPFVAKLQQDLQWTAADLPIDGLSLGYEIQDEAYDMESTTVTRGAPAAFDKGADHNAIRYTPAVEETVMGT